MSRKLRVGVIFGGKSGEHEVSLVSAKGIVGAMDKSRYEIIPIGITKEGRWITDGDPMKALEAMVAGAGKPGKSEPTGERRELVPGIRANFPEVDVVFPVLHGPYGEDGTIQGLLEIADIPYVGAGVLASAAAMDKSITKTIFVSKGLPVVEHMVVKRKEWEGDRKGVIKRIEEKFEYPCFVKPANLGSSVGISKVHNRDELPKALDLAARYDRKMLVERGVNAREIECSVLGNDAPIASVPGEIIPCREFYDYRAKYIDDRSELLIPAPLSPELTRRVRELSTAAYWAIDCAGMARVDFLMDRDTEELFISEVNTIPGFTPISMYPKLWEASGISYSELIDRLIELALERYADKSRLETSYALE